MNAEQARDTGSVTAPRHPARRAMRSLFSLCVSYSFCLLAVLFAAPSMADELRLRDLIEEAMNNNHDILLAGSRSSAARHRIPQVGSLPDPMFMVGYQNEGWSGYTYGKMEGAQWMFSASQMVPFPGKRSLKEEMAASEAESLEAMQEQTRLSVTARVKELYYDLFLAYRNLDLIKEQSSLAARIEEAALARYASGMGSSQEVLMAQREKYMLVEREEMQKQKVQSVETMLNATIGRDANSPLARPAEPEATEFPYSLEELIGAAYENSPDIKSKAATVRSSEKTVGMARKEYYPDVTLTGSVVKRTGEFEDMWSLTATFNIPLFYRDRQRWAVSESVEIRNAALHDYEASKKMVGSGVRDSHSMAVTAQRLMDLYRDALIPKTKQDFELALSAYRTGRTEALTAISSLKSLIDYETSYWEQFTAREKAIARLEALTGLKAGGGKTQ